MQVEQEDDVLPGRAITAVALVTIVIAVALSYWAYALLRSDERALRPSGVFPEADLPRPTEVSGVEQEAFGLRSQAERTEEPARQRLGSYGWVDRDEGVVHVPIDRAIDLYVAEEAGR